jgi:hypothetical protein
MSRAEVWITLSPGTARKVSAMFWAGCEASVSLVTTLIVAGASTSFCDTLEALSTVTSSARRRVSSSVAGGVAGGVC